MTKRKRRRKKLQELVWAILTETGKAVAYHELVRKCNRSIYSVRPEALPQILRVHIRNGLIIKTMCTVGNTQIIEWELAEGVTWESFNIL